MNNDNDDALIGTILTRREALASAAKAGFGLLFAGAVRATLGANTQKVHLVATPEIEEGPFFVDEKLNRSNLVAGTTRNTVVQGLLLTLSVAVKTVQGNALKPIQGAHVDVWHTDAAGVYSDEPKGINLEDTTHQPWLRGYQVTDSHGLARFQTIFPGWYPSRTPHIHLKIRKFSEAGQVTANFTTQLFFDDGVADSIYAKSPYAGRGTRPVYNHNDGLFSQRQVDGTTAGSHLMPTLVKNPSGPGYSAEFSVALIDF